MFLEINDFQVESNTFPSLKHFHLWSQDQDYPGKPGSRLPNVIIFSFWPGILVELHHLEKDTFDTWTKTSCDQHPPTGGGNKTLNGCRMAPQLPSIWHPLEGPGMRTWTFLVWNSFLGLELPLKKWGAEQNTTHINHHFIYTHNQNWR